MRSARPGARIALWLSAAVVLAAAFLRLWALAETDIGLHYDEAAMLLLARAIASGQSFPIFIPAFTGHEVAFHYLAASVLRFGSDSVWGLRLTAALVGTVTVAATMAATRALLCEVPFAPWVALFAGIGMATAFPHVVLSRYGFRAIAQPLFQALALAALWIGLRTRRWGWLAAGGVLIGLTGHTYLAARLFPIPLALALAVVLLSRRDKRALAELLIVLLAAGAVIAPLGIYFAENPDAFGVRLSQVAASSLQEALSGIAKVVPAFGIPGYGDPYIRFNLPGRPMLDPISAAFGLVGLVALVKRPAHNPAERAGRLMIVAGLAVMLLASALATAEITPSNLRLVGVYPFLVILPALGLAEGLAWVLRRLRLVEPAKVLTSIALLALIGGSVHVGQAYQVWARDPVLFKENHGDMALIARALDAANLSDATPYIVSEHYQHPTVAALAQRYPRAKWLTGGETLVLPASGGALYFVPEHLLVRMPQPGAVVNRWTATVLHAPSGAVAARVHHLSPEAVAAIRRELPEVQANFAHVVAVRQAQPLRTCPAGEECPTLVVWETRAPYPALQPVVRAFHPLTGEWGRANPFHYPTGEWTLGEVVLDQIRVPIPPGTPPVSGYRLGIGFFNPNTGETLPRLDAADRFAGVEATFDLGAIAPSVLLPSPPIRACREDSLPNPQPAPGAVTLLAWTPFGSSYKPGERVRLELCWFAGERVIQLGATPVLVRLTGQQDILLYSGAPAAGLLPFSAWQPGQVLRDRPPARLPRDAAPGRYTLQVWLGEQLVAELGSVEVQPLEREFALPKPQHPLSFTLGERIRLLGYDAARLRGEGVLRVQLYWQAMAEADEDYTAFVHLVAPDGRVVAQSDAQPRQGAYPTSLWVRGEVVAEERSLGIEGLPPGEYELRAGMYLPLDGTHLLAPSQERWARLGAVRLE
ncbi:MAG: hypothetical protein NZ693_00710 [Thermoflexales bacterium]|nr:hypothetical protein [Thermoflexales bacterium]